MGVNRQMLAIFWHKFNKSTEVSLSIRSRNFRSEQNLLSFGSENKPYVYQFQGANYSLNLSRDMWKSNNDSLGLSYLLLRLRVLLPFHFLFIRLCYRCHMPFFTTRNRTNGQLFLDFGKQYRTFLYDKFIIEAIETENFPGQGGRGEKLGKSLRSVFLKTSLGHECENSL